MAESSKKERTAACACGSVEFVAVGAPIATVACYCDDCQEGARRIEARPDARAVQDRDGGTTYVVYRKDRVRCTKGASLLEGFKLREGSATNRVVATCCNSAMLLGFDDSKHWVDVYRARFQGAVPPVQMRVCTRFKREGDEIPDDVPRHPAYPFAMVVRLLAARVGMLFSR
jgi:hypothetical protein